ncbi:MAG: hypothetical protein N3F07_02595 [Candidatus Micrarchaeota archaeon]|nr:hypothetical protein [Candidatus Micrarchaeota archaeon]
MSQHILRDLHAKRLAKSQAAGKPDQFMPNFFPSMQPLKESPIFAERKPKRWFKPFSSKIWRWGAFKCQVYLALSDMSEGQYKIRAGQQFIIASGATFKEGAMQPIGFWKRLLGIGNFTHYQLVVEVMEPYPRRPSFEVMYFSKEKLEKCFQSASFKKQA